MRRRLASITGMLSVLLVIYTVFGFRLGATPSGNVDVDPVPNPAAPGSNLPLCVKNLMGSYFLGAGSSSYADAVRDMGYAPEAFEVRTVDADTKAYEVFLDGRRVMAIQVHRYPYGGSFKYIASYSRRVEPCAVGAGAGIPVSEVRDAVWDEVDRKLKEVNLTP